MTAAASRAKIAIWTVALSLAVLGADCRRTRPAADAGAARSAERVKAEFRHAWSAYKSYAWGHDELRPLSKGAHDWYRKPLLMTPVDALDTMLLMGLTAEAAEAKALIFERLTFDADIDVQSFEVTIRLLGGLLSAYEMDGDARLLRLAEDLGRRLLPVYESPTGLPYRFVNLRTGRTRDAVNNPAEIGTALIEFGTLSRLTGNPVYYEKSKRALLELSGRASAVGLVGTTIDVETGAWLDTTAHINGMIDSYYEYLLKSWLLFGDEDCRRLWESGRDAVHRYLADDSPRGLWYGQAEMETGRRVSTRFGALTAFFPAVLALDGDLVRAARLQDSCLRMWNLRGIEPELIDYATMKILDGSYVLRPEIIESAYTLYHFTKDPRYRRMGEAFFEDLVKGCRVDAGYASLKDVATKAKSDLMPSFFLAETLKYLYLLFAPAEILAFDEVVFNTEAHPIKRWETQRPGAGGRDSIEPLLHKNAKLGIGLPGDLGIFKSDGGFPIDPREAARFAAARLHERGVKDILICESRWIAAPLSGYLVDGLGGLTIGGRDFTTFRVGVRDGCEARRGSGFEAGNEFVFIALGRDASGRAVWCPDPGPDIKLGPDRTFPESLLSYEFLMNRPEFESLSVRYGR
jgi:mannosidase alpha-like ER degradation enhancer 2